MVAEGNRGTCRRIGRGDGRVGTFEEDAIGYLTYPPAPFPAKVAPLAPNVGPNVTGPAAGSGDLQGRGERNNSPLLAG